MLRMVREETRRKFVFCPDLPARGIKAALAFSIVNHVCTALLYGRAGHLSAKKHAGFWPGQCVVAPR
jgi:hypothetical protein